MNNNHLTSRIGSSKRRRFSPTQIQQLLDDFHRSGLSAAAFARQHGLCYTAFCRWRKRQPTSSPRLRPLPIGALLGPAWAAEIALTDGSALRLGAHVSAAWATELLRSLRRPC